MSSYQALTFHPETGIAETAFWLDDYFGHYVYGVKFADGQIFNVEETNIIKANDQITIGLHFGILLHEDFMSS